MKIWNMMIIYEEYDEDIWSKYDNFRPEVDQYLI